MIYRIVLWAQLCYVVCLHLVDYVLSCEGMVSSHAIMNTSRVVFARRATPSSTRGRASYRSTRAKPEHMGPSQQR